MPARREPGRACAASRLPDAHHTGPGNWAILAACSTRARSGAHGTAGMAGIHPGARSDRPIGESETLHVPVQEEAITGVKKETVVTGEINVRKHSEQRTKQVSDTVQREEPHIEKEGNLRVRGKS